MCSYVRYDMLLCRRLLFTADPQYPAVTFFAKLPSLVFHINEHKVGVVTDFEIIKCFNKIMFTFWMLLIQYFTVLGLLSSLALDPNAVHCFGIYVTPTLFSS